MVFGVVPAGIYPCVYPAQNIRALAVAYNKNIFPVLFGNIFNYIIVIFLFGLLVPRVLGNKDPVEIFIQPRAAYALVLGQRNAVCGGIKAIAPRFQVG